ncbi:nucleolar protein 9 [Euwallacea similis]|uniref:nucleolar protein 9 n=1 Tax=Euwallacea similis TaxID=1736056 RepID=UPI00344F2EE3
MSSEASVKRKNRKRKKTFLGNARKYAKKGCFGRGSKMDEDTYQFFLRSLETFRLGFDDEELKSIFVDNVFEHTENQEIECSTNQVGCRVIETLLPFANDSILQRFIEKFSSNLRPLIYDRFASFVLQQLVVISSKKSLSLNLPEDKRTYHKNFALKVSKFLLNNLEDYTWDNIGNRVIRICLCCLTQIPLENKQNATAVLGPDSAQKDKLPEEFIEVVTEFGQRLLLWPQFNEMCFSELTSGLFQVLLKALKKTDSKLLKQYLEKLLTGTFVTSKSDLEEDLLPQGFLSVSLVILLETALQVAGKKMFNLYLEKLFLGRMVKLACLKSTTFAVQKALAQCANKEQFDPLFDELSDHFGEIIEKGHPAVILTIGQTCKRLSSKQGLFIQNMLKTLNCHEPEERLKHFVICMSRLTPLNENSTSNQNLAKERLNLQGTLMLQLMLEFNKPIKVVNSLLAMEVQDLRDLFSNSMGSHIVDSYVKSEFVGEKSRERLVRKMAGTYQDLAASKYGSRSFEALWNAANLKAKTQIMEELAYKEGSWSNTDFGRIIASKINLVLYKRSKEMWKNAVNNTAKPEKALADVLK